jgi:organic radical activating enzyme
MKCSYCYNKFPRNNIDIDIHLLLKYIDDVYKKTSRIIDIMLVGGEPSLHNDIIMFIKECRTRKFINVIDVFTNFSNELFFYKTLINNKINLVCSWHDETNDEMFIKNLNSLTKNERKFIVEIAMMFEHKNIYRWINVITKIIGNYKNVIQPWILFNKYDIMEYSQS